MGFKKLLFLVWFLQCIYSPLNWITRVLLTLLSLRKWKPLGQDTTKLSNSQTHLSFYCACMLHVGVCVCMWGVGLHQERFQKLLARILGHIFAFSTSLTVSRAPEDSLFSQRLCDSMKSDCAESHVGTQSAKNLGLSLSRIKDSYPIQLTNPLPFGEKSE